MEFKIRVIKKRPPVKYTKYGFNIKPKRASCQVFQWPSGSRYSLFVRKPTKHWGRYCEGILLGVFFDLEKAKKAAVQWPKKNRK